MVAGVVGGGELAAELLYASAGGRAATAQRGLQRGEPEVGDLHLVLVEEDVLGLEVAVDDALVVQVRQPLQQLRLTAQLHTHLPEEVDAHGERRGALVQHVAQRSVAAVLHLDEQRDGARRGGRGLVRHERQRLTGVVARPAVVVVEDAVLGDRRGEVPIRSPPRPARTWESEARSNWTRRRSPPPSPPRRSS